MYVVFAGAPSINLPVTLNSLTIDELRNWCHKGKVGPEVHPGAWP